MVGHQHLHAWHTAIAPIMLAKFRRLEHKVELANEELKQARAMGEAAKRKAKRAKVGVGFPKRKQISSR
nr:hypothetical protein CFP56_58455 [Quercus suber]